MHQEKTRRCDKYICRVSFLFVCILSYLLHSPDVFALGNEYLDQVLASARQQRLYEERYWHILLHYKEGVFGIESLIDDPAFFLAPDGKTNPASEMEATIRAFFNPQNDEVCRFAARFEWLRERLDLDTARLPVPRCASVEEFINSNNPESVTLVFPMSNLNSPASMYGHTLLTIETAGKTKLLAYSVSYSAVSRETFGPLFAVKGIFGLYPGYFAVLPYYAKLQQYSDVDHRDIWEYPLDLTKPEIRRMLLHIREMEAIASDYYFFGENCSYMLFFLLEAARPSLTLSDEGHAWVIPLDTIRMIERQGMIKGANYRPSRTTKIKSLASQTSTPGKVIALSLARGEYKDQDPFSGTGLSKHEKIKACELAGEYLQYLYTKDKVPEKTYQGRFLKILKMRSSLGISREESLYRISEPVRPEKGHLSNRIALGMGVRKDEVFGELRLRPSYHSLADNDDGYIEGAQLIFADLALRYYGKKGRLRLESFDIVDIFSISPGDMFFHPISWKVKTGLTRVIDKDKDDRLAYQINTGGGMARKGDTFGLGYMMLETDVLVSAALENNNAAGIGGSAGLIKNIDKSLKVHFSLRDIYYGLGDTFNSFEAAMKVNFTMDPNKAVSINVSRSRTRDFYSSEFTVLWNVFF